MGILTDFTLSLLNLTVFWYYVQSFLKPKDMSGRRQALAIILLAGIWAFISRLGSYRYDMLCSAAALGFTLCFFHGRILAKGAMLIVFMAAGTVMEPLGRLIHGIICISGENTGQCSYIAASFIYSVRACVFYVFSRLFGGKKIHLSILPKEIMGAVMAVPLIAILECCFVIELAVETGTGDSLNLCVSIVVSVVLTYYLLLYVMERFSYYADRKREDELYMEEMRYKAEYYSEMESQNEYVQNFRHDIKNRLSGLIYLLEKGDTDAMSEQVRLLYGEIEQAGGRKYSQNPVVDSVLRVKMGAASEEGIRINTKIQIPGEIGLACGDIGVIYGNLLDNAIEACRMVDKDRRYIDVENKYADGNLLLIIRNSKHSGTNTDLHTTKADSMAHGRGILSVKRTAEKYSGTASFKDKGDSFEASVVLYMVQ